MVICRTADFGGSELLGPFTRSRLLTSLRSLLSTAGDVTSGKPGFTDVPAIRGGMRPAAASGCICKSVNVAGANLKVFYSRPRTPRSNLEDSGNSVRSSH